MSNEWIPLYIKPTGLRVKIFGGGSVAARRARLFSNAGAEVQVFAIEFSSELKEMERQGKVKLYQIDLRYADLDKMLQNVDIIVIAVDDEELARIVSRKATEKGKLVNNAVNALEGNVIVPYRGKTSYGLYIATTSLGATGVAARRTLERLLKILEEDPYYKTLFIVMSRVKKYLKERVPNPKIRFKANLAADAEEKVHQLAEQGHVEDAYEIALGAALKTVDTSSDPAGKQVTPSLEESR